jgi:Protein of unknown function (DUF2905)
LVTIGLAIVAVDLLWSWIARLGLARLPGDIRIERGDFTFYAPITTGTPAPSFPSSRDSYPDDSSEIGVSPFFRLQRCNRFSDQSLDREAVVIWSAGPTDRYDHEVASRRSLQMSRGYRQSAGEGSPGSPEQHHRPCGLTIFSLATTASPRRTRRSVCAMIRSISGRSWRNSACHSPAAIGFAARHNCAAGLIGVNEGRLGQP